MIRFLGLNFLMYISLGFQHIYTVKHITAPSFIHVNPTLQ